MRSQDGQRSFAEIIAILARHFRFTHFWTPFSGKKWIVFVVRAERESEL